MPLAGVPFAVKNLFDVAGLPTLAGSKIERDAAPPVPKLETARAQLESADELRRALRGMEEPARKDARLRAAAAYRAVREHFPAAEAGSRVGTVLMCMLLGMALGGWMSGKVFDLTGSYHAAFLNGIGWNLLNLTIAITLLRRTCCWQLSARMSLA